MLDCLGRCLG